MNKVHATRLLNVAKALRESPRPEAFTMSRETVDADQDWCGTPGCAFGHYAARTDLQRFCRIQVRRQYGGSGLRSNVVEYANPLNRVGVYGRAVAEHFGLSNDERMELFDVEGCNNAQTPTAAAKYIERFVKRKQRAAKVKSKAKK